MRVKVRAVLMRGGTSKALFFREEDLAAFPLPQRDRLLALALGSPDPYGRQVDGLGGGFSSASKVALIAPGGGGADVDFTFGQVDVTSGTVEFRGLCGNIAAAVGPYALEEGLVTPREPVTPVRVRVTSTGQVYVAHVPVAGELPRETGDLVVDGVPRPGAPVLLDFPAPEGALGRGLLPTGRPVDRYRVPGLGEVEASVVDAGNPTVFVEASALGLSGRELPEELAARPEALERLEVLRAQAAVALGLAETPEEASVRVQAIPKVAVVAPPAAYRTTGGQPVGAGDADLLVRALSMGRPHHAVPASVALSAAVGAVLPGTVLARVARPALGQAAGEDGIPVRLGHPAGTAVLGVKVRRQGGGVQVEGIRYYRTARRLMEGYVCLPLAWLEGWEG